jgi:hypothetical protein
MLPAAIKGVFYQASGARQMSRLFTLQSGVDAVFCFMPFAPKVTTIAPMENRPGKLSLSRILKLSAARGGELDKTELAVLKTTNTEWKRHRFLDMYLYNR